jgi:hypothetical protein
MKYRKRIPATEVIVYTSFIILAFIYFCKESPEGSSSADFNSIAREIPVVVKKYPDNFSDDAITNKDAMSGVRYIWTQKIILEKGYDLTNDFYQYRRIMLAILVFLTSCTTYILFKYLTKNSIASAVATVATVIGYVYGIDEMYGFDGVWCAVSRYNLGIFAPLLLLYFIKYYKFPSRLLLFFLLVGMGVNLHPPVAINMAIIFAVAFLITNGIKEIKWVFYFIIMVLAGSSPFIYDFGDAAFSRGTVEASMSAAEFYGTKSHLLTNDFLIEPFNILLQTILFPPIISFLSLIGAFYLHNNWNKSNPNPASENSATRVLVILVLTSYFLLLINIILFGWVIPHVIGPNAFSLHRVHRVFYLVAGTLLVTYLITLWSDKSYSRNFRALIIGVIIINLSLGFNWLQRVDSFAKMILHVPLDYLNIVKLTIQISFLLSVLYSFYRLCIYRKSVMQGRQIIILIIIVTIPNFCLSGGYKFAKAIGYGPLKQRLDKRQMLHISRQQLSQWALKETRNDDLFIFMSDEDSCSYYFKTRAIRSTYPTRTEILHYMPVRRRAKYINMYESYKNELIIQIRNGDASLCKQLAIDYVVCPRSDKEYDLASALGKAIYKNGHYAVYSLRNL